MLKAHLVDKALTTSIRLVGFNCRPERAEKVLPVFNLAVL